MKKSEMIKDIEGFFEAYYPVDKKDIPDLLAWIEKSGMAPPDIQKCNCKYCSPRHEWERED